MSSAFQTKIKSRLNSALPRKSIGGAVGRDESRGPKIDVKREIGDNEACASTAHTTTPSERASVESSMSEITCIESSGAEEKDKKRVKGEKMEMEDIDLEVIDVDEWDKTTVVDSSAPSRASSTDAKPGSASAGTKVAIKTTEGARTFKLLTEFDTFWYYASERHQVEMKRRQGLPPPWTDDRTLRFNKFTSIFRVADRGTQFLITDVIEKGSRKHVDILFRVLLYSTFVRVETYQLLELELGPLTWDRYDAAKYTTVLQGALNSGIKIYTGAFQKVAPKLGHGQSFRDHLVLLEVMMNDNLLTQLESCQYMADAFDAIYRYPGSGDFITYQLLMNLSYTPLLSFSENDYVVAGVGAKAGLALCFSPKQDISKVEASLIRWMMETQDEHFARLGLPPARLGKEEKPMSLADIEHTLCELHKYIRMRKGGHAKEGFKQRTKVGGMPRYPTLPSAWSDPKRLIVRIKKGRKDGKRPEKIYVVKAILDRGESEDGETLYLVDWLGYEAKDRTWEPENMLQVDAPKLVLQFEKAHPRMEVEVVGQKTTGKAKASSGEPPKKRRRSGRGC